MFLAKIRTSHTSHVSESVWLSGVDRGKEEVVSVPRCDDGGVRPVLPNLNQVFVDEAEPSYIAQSYPRHEYGTYHSYTENQDKLEYEKGAKDFQENDNKVEEGANDFEENDNEVEECAKEFEENDNEIEEGVMHFEKGVDDDEGANEEGVDDDGRANEEGANKEGSNDEKKTKKRYDITVNYVLFMLYNVYIILE
ncbi:hypothetical protein HanXRQr2_Chr15g0718741 [Helianthus annuus]|uniref:Uncharacterized protein n=1 Tax=Helianthus annuus TaxID=4232 RepID=A0A9K3E4A1_HELAN|nr:hypothetical protein HanXRQr2_Chr15g0718741 [Helianthus annuus]KAJ0453067.1 hypothetical protein HanHA300_Chr15g0586181 [Helianthus annuus]KAJ0474977.1 hypothetical protein HanHA89_Chr15g0635921 [Helianthus annuus]KAJ0650532.1 hypothetical protein HanLR1_Chr15g0596831 [Helianthus annuus]KAJ0654285.1 hypothetical protein HanOQP8_Chr15g0593251 [Helianthus annuus]